MPSSQSDINVSELASALAAVAIAGVFGGPVAVAKEALTRSVPFIRSRYEADKETRSLMRDLNSALRDWANGEHIRADQLQSGMAAAVAIVNEAALGAGEMARLGFDPRRVVAELISRAKARDRLWGSEAHYAVAERALDVLYSHLVAKVKAGESTLIPILTNLREDLDLQLKSIAAAIAGQGVQIDGLWQQLVASASLTDVLTYLRIRMVDWDRHLWLPTQKSPSTLERRLRASADDPSKSAAGDQEPEIFSADDVEAVFGDRRVLVVLGGPGSGKTWLARRYARDAARAAMESLEQGVDLSQVEIPLFTTWGTWAKVGGEVRKSLIDAAFEVGFGNSDLGGGDVIDRLKRTLQSSGSKALMVVDSLDEAADEQGQGNNYQSLTSVGDWRVIVTSRPAAWHSMQQSSAQTERVANLLELEYPGDVEGFVDAWFDGQATPAEGLKAAIRERPELRRSCVVPLLLTFYCIFTEDRGVGLPSLRRDLYQQLIELLIERGWHHDHPGADNQPDLEDCLALLRQWAWDAVKGQKTEAGLGNWGDTFTPTRGTAGPVAKAVKAIAPPVASSQVPPRLRSRRRTFIHRTFLEHLVAEYIATLPTQEAAAALLPHLWFDSDWEVAAPAAIAAHHSRLPGVLLEVLLMQAQPSIDDPPRRETQFEFAQLLAKAGRESSHPLWTDSDSVVEIRRGQLVATIIAALPTARLGVVSRLVGVLPQLGASEQDRQAAIEAIRQALPTADPGVVSDLVGVLPQLGASEQDRQAAIEAILQALPTASDDKIRSLVNMIRELTPLDTWLRWLKSE